MASLKFRIRESRRLANGMYAVYLAVMKGFDVRFINTDVSVPAPENFSNGRVVGLPDADNMNARLDYLMKICNDKMRFIRKGNFTCKQFKDYLVESLEKASADMNVNTLSQLFDFYISRLQSEGRNRSAEMFSFTRKKVLQQLGDVSIFKINQMDIKKMIMTMRSKDFTDGCVNIYMKHLKTLLRFAVNEGLVVYKVFPFQDIHIPKASVVFRDLTEDDFIRLKNYPIAEKDLCFVRDMFLLSFYLGGMPMQDLRRVDLMADRIVYVSSRNLKMKKYVNEISFSVVPEAREIINRYSVNGKFVWPAKLDLLDVKQYFRSRLKRLGKELDLELTITALTPGKTFGQFGCMAGVETDVLRHCVGLNVDLQSPIYNYVKVVNSLTDKAIRQVIDYIADYERSLSEIFTRPCRMAL